VAAKLFSSEAAMCMEFVSAVRQRGWLASPETSGWDILLCRDGVQVGVQAKLKANFHVLEQALEPSRRKAGPNHHAVLVPEANWQFAKIAAACGILTIWPVDAWVGYGEAPTISWDQALTRLDKQLVVMPEWVHTRPAWMPGVEILIPAGASGPQKVTVWKLAAVRLSLLLRSQGYLTVEDFKAEAQDKRWWVDSGIVAGVKRDGAWRWEPCEGVLGLPKPDQTGHKSAAMPDRRWPEIALAIQRGGS
jgi:hypothetical protein